MCSYSHLISSLLLLCQYWSVESSFLFTSDIQLDLSTRRYNNIVVIVNQEHSEHKCKQILTDIQVHIN